MTESPHPLQEQLPSRVLVQEVRTEDWPRVKRLRLAALKNDPQAFGESHEAVSKRTDEEWQERVSRSVGSEGHNVMVLATDGETAIGMIGAFPRPDGAWVLNQVYVDPAYRGQNISQELLRQALETIRNKGASTVELSVNTQQEAAVRAYQKAGFVIVSTERDQRMGDGNVHDEYVMRLDFAR